MSEDITFVGTFAIPEDRLEEWRAAIVDMVDTVKANVPRLVSFNVYVNDDATEGTSIYVHPDAESFERHMEVAASRIGAGAQMVDTIRVELYGNPSERVVERLHRISEASNSFPVTVKKHYYGS